ncbi:hypothetical protein ACIQ9K_35650 [Streptomyces microflavus]|uniref:hypothetical protein n=1 Tax=Streptomyces microflavus TaxID=1919 RepID=UPI0037F1C1CA
MSADHLRSVPLDEPGLRGRDGTDAANATRNLRLRVLVGDEDGQRRAVVVADAPAEILTGRGTPADVVPHHLPAPAQA